MKNFLDQIKTIIAKEPQPDPKWAPKLIIYWTTKKDGQIYHDLSTGERIAQADATRYTEWGNYDSKYIKYSANASPRFTYLKFHKKENIMELAYINIPTNRAKEKETREWSWGNERYFVDLNEYPRTIVDDRGNPDSLFGVHAILKDTSIKTKYQIDKEMFGPTSCDPKLFCIWEYYDKLERFIKLKKNPNTKKAKTAKELLIEKGNALLEESPTDFPVLNNSVSIIRNFEQISIMDTAGAWCQWRFYFDGKTYAVAKGPRFNKVSSVNLARYATIYNPEDLNKGQFAKYADLFVKPEAQERPWGVELCIPEFPRNKTANSRALVCMIKNPMLEKIAKSYGGVRRVEAFSGKSSHSLYFGEDLDKKAKTPEKWLGVNKYQLTKLIQFMNSPQGLSSWSADQAIRIFKEAIGENVAAIDNHTSDLFINNLNSICDLDSALSWGGLFGAPREVTWTRQTLKKIIRSNRAETLIPLLRDTVVMWTRLENPKPPLEDIPVSELSRLHDTFVAMYNEQQRHWRERYDEQKRKELEKRAKLNKVKIEFRKTLEFEDKDYLIRLPVDKNEIVKEGMELHHCVGGYAERHEAGDTTIMFLRKKSEPDKPFYTIEVGIEVLTDTVSELRISQIHGFGNRWLGNDPDAIPTVVRWLRQNAIECDEAILTSTSTQYAMGRNFIKMPEVA